MFINKEVKSCDSLSTIFKIYIVQQLSCRIHILQESEVGIVKEKIVFYESVQFVNNFKTFEAG